jgi:hypothetical protein
VERGEGKSFLMFWLIQKDKNEQKEEIKNEINREKK